MNSRPRPAGLPSAGRGRHLRRLVLAVIGVAAIVSTAVGARTLLSPDVKPVSRNVGAFLKRTPSGGLASLQAHLRRVPDDHRGWAQLGSIYVQQARVTGDTSFYPKADEALHRSLRLLKEGNVEALTGLGALAAARHDFPGALDWATRSQDANPRYPATYGVMGDALIELGRYEDGFAALQRMVDLRPDFASYSRASYAQELQGNIENAVRALELALQAASDPNDAAFANFHLGELRRNAGRLDDAERFYARSAASAPDGVLGIYGLARVAFGRGDLQAAIDGYERVVERMPLPSYVADLADLYELVGQPAKAREQFALLDVQERLLQANGVNIDVEQALFKADHGVDLAGALRVARAAWNERKSIFVADALAWTLYANGAYLEARTYARHAMRLGTRNASFYFHAGMIERALGNRETARRLIARARAIDPHFSIIWSRQVPEILRDL